MPATVPARAAVHPRTTAQLLTTVLAREFPLQTEWTMQRRATLAETAGRRSICIGQS